MNMPNPKAATLLCTALAILLILRAETGAGEYFDTVAGTSHMLVSEAVTCAIDMRSGHIKGLYDNETGQQYLSASYDTYYLKTEDGNEVKAGERDDKIEDAGIEEGVHVELVCTNPALPYATIRKRYFFAEVGGQKRIVCRRIEVTGKPEQPTLFSSVSNTLFDPDFRDDARYHYVFPQGAAGNPHPLMHASKITRPIARRDHGTDEIGRAALDAWNPTFGAGFAQYTYKVNGHWTYPRALTRQTYWTGDGWQMGSGGFFITDEPHSVETRYHVFFKDRLQIHFEYLDLPEFKALRDATTPLPGLARVLSPGTGGSFVRPGDHGIGFHNVLGVPEHLGQYQWGVFADADDVVLHQMSFKDHGQVLHTVTARELKATFAEQRSEAPHMLSGMYIYRGCLSPVIEARPHWIRRIDEARGIVYAKQIPEVADVVAKGIAREAEYLGTGLFYVDGALDFGGIDWDSQHVSQMDMALHEWRRLYEELHKRGKFLWTNMRTGSVYYDVAYYEVSGAHVVPGKTWRDGADMDLMNKIYQVPGTMHIPLYWWVNGPLENNRRYQNLCLGLALSPRGGAWAHKVNGDWPILPNETCFGAAVDEYRDARFVRIGLEPAWWNDLETDIEAYTLRHGDTVLVNAINHADEVEDVMLSVDVDKLGFDRKRMIFLWEHQARPALIAGSQYPDDQIDKLYVSRKLRMTKAASRRLKIALPRMPPHRIRVCALTQTPAFIYSADGIPTQNLLSETLGCKITGNLDVENRTSTLDVQARRPIQVLAYWPAEWGAATVTANGQPAGHEATQVGGTSFTLVDVPKGQSTLLISPADS